MPFAATWMQLEIIILSEVYQKEKVKYRMISFTCGIYWAGQKVCSVFSIRSYRKIRMKFLASPIKYDTNELIYETETESRT